MKEMRISFEVKVALKRTDVHFIEEELLRIREKVFLEVAHRILAELEREAIKGTPRCKNCGSPLVKNGKEPKRIKTLLGTVGIRRMRLRCVGCTHDTYPLDDALGLTSREGMTLGFKERCL